MKIPEAAVEAAARAAQVEWGVNPWGELSYQAERALAEDAKDALVTLARYVLEAAAPHMLAEVFDAGFTTCSNEHTKQRNDPSHPITRLNPYRSAS